MTPRTPPPRGEMFHKQFECLNVKDCLTLGERDDYGSNAFHLLQCCLHRWVLGGENSPSISEQLFFTSSLHHI